MLIRQLLNALKKNADSETAPQMTSQNVSGFIEPPIHPYIDEMTLIQYTFIPVSKPNDVPIIIEVD